MEGKKSISSALISVYDKTGLEPIVKKLAAMSVKIISTGGTESYIRSLGIEVIPVESLTSYPHVFGGRVKTLHPAIFGGILFRGDEENDVMEAEKYDISRIDLVVVDLYPFRETVASGGSDEEIIEKIDIGGISLIRAAAKNFKDVVIIPSKVEYKDLDLILENKGNTELDIRRKLALKAFMVSSSYDQAIAGYFAEKNEWMFSAAPAISLRYGENPHQKGTFYGDLESVFTKLSGKEISYNNLLDIHSAIALLADFADPCVAVIKHNNACGLASANSITESWKKALQGDPLSAFGGVIISNREIDINAAKEMDKIFFEVVMAPDFSDEAVAILSAKKNRIILKLRSAHSNKEHFRSLLNGVLVQDEDLKTETEDDLKVVTKKKPSASEVADLLFANKIVKHSKSNAIVLVKNKQLLGMGCGQTSRVDALKHAINKALENNLDLRGAVMSSDAFFPFPDCVEIAAKAGVTSVIQPGGSVRDNDSVLVSDQIGISMVTTGFRHFKH